MKNRFKLNNYFVISKNISLKSFKYNKNIVDFEYGPKTPIKIIEENSQNIDIFIGHPTVFQNDQLIDFITFWKKNENDIDSFKKIDCEFAIIQIINNKIRIINSRFSSPQIFYYYNNDIFLASTNYFVNFELREYSPR